MATSRPTDEQLVDGGHRAIARFGLQGATLERIAEEAGVSRVTLHRRGITKQRIVDELTRRAVEEYRSALWPALTGSGTAAERLEQALEALCEIAERYLDLLVAFGGASDAVFHDDAAEALTRSPFTEPIERLLRDGSEDATLRQLDPGEMATVLFNLVGWTYIHLRVGHGWNVGRARGTTLAVALHGVVSH